MQSKTKLLIYFTVAALCLCAALLAIGQGTKIRSEKDADEAGRDHPVERQQWFREGRTVKGAHAASLLQRAFISKMQLHAAQRNQARAAVAALPSWQNLGPDPLTSDPTGFQSYGPVTGRTTSIAIDQNDTSGNTVYIGGAYGGVWKANNATAAPGAVSWIPLTDGQPTLAAGAIALKPDTSGASTVILVGTGEPDDSGDSYYGLGILRSADGGASWQVIGSDTLGHGFRGLGFSRIAFNTTAGNTSQVVAAASNMTNGPRLGATGNAVPWLYYSTDAGQTWTLSSVSDDSANSTLPTSASDVVFNPADNKFYALLRRHGLYSSADGGKTWQRLASQPGPGLSAAACPYFINVNCPLFRGHIAVQPNTGELFVAYMAFDSSNNEALQGVFRSADGGASWSADLGQAGYVNCGDTSGCGASQSVYNFYLTAVPHGPGTDLYMGGINIYRCSLAPGATSCAWANLTHVYGCNPIAAAAHVHPDQHGMAFLATNPQLMYFVNDGGIYRSSNGAAVDGTCNAANAGSWQNLNGSMGAMTEFISLAQDPVDSSIVLGGTQDNGSPALHAGNWSSVNTGDGGYSEIDPTDRNIWYTSNFFLSVQRCTLGTNCDAPTFTDVISNQKAAGDNSSFYPPYMLDPRDSHKIIAGTCRVWRGAADGSGWPGANALSLNWSENSNAPCSAGDTMISALAAGGPPAPSGASSVIYAGRADGTIYVSTAAESGPASFVDRSATLFSNGYKISGIAVDANDPSGNTAVATVMGFGVGHVWRTTNAGQSWTDISGNLPDAPADSVLVDSADPAHIFAGTDVGIFETHNSGAAWTEAGAGLPNIPTTRLLLFDGPGTRRLRASTYGRGVWELSLPAVPFFSLQVAPGASPSASVAAGQPATYNLALASINGFTGTVSFSCSAAGGTCSISPVSASLTNASAVMPVTVTVSTGAHASARPLHFRGWPVVFAALFGGVLAGAARKSKALMLLALFAVAGTTACGGGNGGGTSGKQLQPNTPVLSASTVIVTASSGNVTRSVSLGLTVQ